MDWKTCLETIFKMEQLQCAFEQETYGRIHTLGLNWTSLTFGPLDRTVWRHHHRQGCQPRYRGQRGRWEGQPGELQ